MYSFDIKYRVGKTNVDVDGLSRRPQEPLKETIQIDERIASLLSKAECAATEFKKLGQEEIKGVCLRHSVSCEMHTPQQCGGRLVGKQRYPNSGCGDVTL
ncbi:Alpha-1A adrenergic receptor [Labeo rohita]|uniref:Alpha-1A adrenergic receptor n=1 Tax=Labeo rohita TaxID=84645 RepID=A0ABQ8L4B4_LABRO|nr:Alpha-1A adrenergic receptor [Labeo rohita]